LCFFYLVEVALEDRDSDTFIVVNEAGIDSAMNGDPEGAQWRADQPVKRKRNKRSLIWRHYELLDSLAAARCCICMKKLDREKNRNTTAGNCFMQEYIIIKITLALFM